MENRQYTGFSLDVGEAGVATIRYTTPERLNGFQQPIKRELIELLQQIQMDESVRVVIITGSGRAFCAGDDITGRPLQGANAAQPLLPPIGRGHGSPIGTYDGLR